jgi:hypothetical protein
MTPETYTAQTRAGRYSIRPSGDGFEVLLDDHVIAWTMGGYWAVTIVALLAGAERHGLTQWAAAAIPGGVRLE